MFESRRGLVPVGIIGLDGDNSAEFFLPRWETLSEGKGKPKLMKTIFLLKRNGQLGVVWQ